MSNESPLERGPIRIEFRGLCSISVYYKLRSPRARLGALSRYSV